DLRDIWTYLRTLTPSNRVNQTHDLRFPYGFRILVTAWKWLFFTAGPSPDAAATSATARGAYLTLALGHCGECHTPRNFLGGPKSSRLLAGGVGPEGKGIPNLTPARLKKWNDRELQEFLQTGILPDGDVAAEAMGEVVRNTTSKLVPADLAAVIAYLRSLPEIADEPK
ncbi:MAG: alkylated DNA repair protein, partial [Betaproteobacteria bacterium]|nr:alkylated DNA repair protein [Betaproteobacteria bacterium]